MSRNTVDWDALHRVCADVAKGRSLVEVLPAYPPLSQSVFCAWMLREQSASQLYARARARRAEFIFEEMLTIANTPCEGVKTVHKQTDNGDRIETTKGDMIEHRRLQVDTRKWILARMDPGKYGERIEVEHSGTVTQVQPSDVRRALQDCPLLAELQDAPAVVDVPQGATE